MTAISSNLHVSRGKHGRKSESTGKSNFVETRTFWNIFRSFDRLWTFYILALQVMVTVAWTGTTSPLGRILYNVSSVFITAARFLQSILDLVLNFRGYHRWKFTDVLRNILKMVVSPAWLIVLPLCYIRSLLVVPTMINELLPHVSGIPPLYITAMGLYLLPNALTGVCGAKMKVTLYFFPGEDGPSISRLSRWLLHPSSIAKAQVCKPEFELNNGLLCARFLYGKCLFNVSCIELFTKIISEFTVMKYFAKYSILRC